MAFFISPCKQESTRFVLMFVLFWKCPREEKIILNWLFSNVNVLVVSLSYFLCMYLCYNNCMLMLHTVPEPC